jgi:hypothetical protein
VCTCVFLLHQESLDMILVNNLSFYDGGITLREFGLEPKGRARTYHKPYPEFFNTVPYPRGFRVPDLVKFTGEDSKTTYAHIGLFLVQDNDFGITDIHKIRLFPLSIGDNV